MGSDGTVWSCHVRGIGKVIGDEWRVLKPIIHPNGYPTVHVRDGGRRRKRTIHSLVLQAFVGPCPPGMQACHGDGVYTNCHLSNLRWDTPKSNQQDSIKHGTKAEQARKVSKLTPEQVREIRASSDRAVDLAVRFGVVFQTIYRIRNGDRWKHLD